MTYNTSNSILFTFTRDKSYHNKSRFKKKKKLGSHKVSTVDMSGAPSRQKQRERGRERERCSRSLIVTSVIKSSHDGQGSQRGQAYFFFFFFSIHLRLRPIFRAIRLDYMRVCVYARARQLQLSFSLSRFNRAIFHYAPYIFIVAAAPRERIRDYYQKLAHSSIRQKCSIVQFQLVELFILELIMPMCWMIMMHV